MGAETNIQVILYGNSNQESPFLNSKEMSDFLINRSDFLKDCVKKITSFSVHFEGTDQ
jgi:hypothetical protein